jgi:hypothetical protein
VTAGRVHLHRIDHPLTLDILSELLDHRGRPPDGYERTDQGAWVDWDALTGSYLSSTEIAVIHIVHGCAIAERHGGLPPAAMRSVRQAIGQLTGGHAPSRWPRSGPPSRSADANQGVWPDPTGPEMGL